MKLDATYLFLSFIPLWGAIVAVMLAALFKVSTRLLLLVAQFLSLPVGVVLVNIYMRDGRAYYGDNPGVGVANVPLISCWGLCLAGTLIYALIVQIKR